MPTDTDDIELEATFEELALNLLCDAVESDVAFRNDRALLRRDGGRHGCTRSNA